MANHCLFKDVLQNSCKTKFHYYKDPLSHSEIRLGRVKEASIERDDDLHKTLDTISDKKFHQNCYNTYISSQHIERHKKRKREETIKINLETTGQTPPPQKKTRYFLYMPCYMSFVARLYFRFSTS